jgi:hypothetical protein
MVFSACGNALKQFSESLNLRWTRRVFKRPLPPKGHLPKIGLILGKP